MSVRKEQHACHSKDFHDAGYLKAFRTSVERVKFHWNLTRTKGTLHENQSTCMITSRWILLKMRNVLNIAEELEHIFCVQYLFPRIELFMVTPWSTVLPEKLTGPTLLNRFPAFYATRKFITAFTTARHLSLSSARSIKSMPPSHYSLTLILILSSPSTSRSSKWSLP
jgi:hypothetical protein